jgi:hypothetical protein
MKRVWVVLFSCLLMPPMTVDAAALSDTQQVQVACSLLLHDLANAYSERDAARGAALFTADGVWEVDGAVFKGTEQLRKRLSELPPTVVVLLTTIYITPVDKTTASGVSYATVLAADRPREDTKPHGTYEPIHMDGFTFVVVYRDNFRLTNDGWRLAKRVTNRIFVGPGQTKDAKAAGGVAVSPGLVPTP